MNRDAFVSFRFVGFSLKKMNSDQTFYIKIYLLRRSDSKWSYCFSLFCCFYLVCFVCMSVCRNLAWITQKMFFFLSAVCMNERQRNIGFVIVSDSFSFSFSFSSIDPKRSRISEFREYFVGSWQFEFNVHSMKYAFVAATQSEHRNKY